MTTSSGMKHRARTPPRRQPPTSSSSSSRPPTIPHGGPTPSQNSPTRNNAAQEERKRKLAAQRRMKLKQSDASFASLGSSGGGGGGAAGGSGSGSGSGGGGAAISEERRRKFQNAHTYHPPTPKKYYYIGLGVAAAVSLLLALLFLFNGQQHSSNDFLHPKEGELGDATIRVFSISSSSSKTDSRMVNIMSSMMYSPATTTSEIQYRVYTPYEGYKFLSQYGSQCAPSSPPPLSSSSSEEGNVVLKRYESLTDEVLKEELWKYCMLYTGMGNAFVDVENTLLLQTFMDGFGGDDSSSSQEMNYGVLMDEISEEEEGMIHSSFLYIATRNSKVAKGMIRLIVETSNHVLESSPLLLPRELYRLISAETDVTQGSEGGQEEKEKKKEGETEWVLLSTHCTDLADPSSASKNHEWDDVNVLHAPPPNPSSSGEMLPLDYILKQSQRRNAIHSQYDSLASLISTSVTPTANSHRITFQCPLAQDGFCCRVYDGNNREVLALRHPVGPLLSSSTTSDDDAGKKEEVKLEDTLPYLYHKYHEKHPTKHNAKDEDKAYTEIAAQSKESFDITHYTLPKSELPYIATVRENILRSNYKKDMESTSEPSPTPNFFDILLQNDCLPSSKQCQKCLKNYEPETEEESSIAGYDCDRCAVDCFCYCSVLCKVRPPKKVVVKEFEVTVPRFRKDVDRLIPRIIHQTWYEPVTKEKYPNMSRLIESWRKSGWEYNFYDDDSAGEFLSTHFPPEVREAYESITPGAFKADLFRYCVLLIRGGVYSDMDVLLEANLDAAVANDVGFMTPIDEPGMKVDHRSCLWNGLIAVAPGHPFLAKTIEIVVNNIRNKFTSVDYDDMLCPKPVLSVSHRVDTLFTCGPCILGAGINALLGRHMQDQFEIGDVDIWHSERNAQGDDGNVVVSPDDPRLLIPGRTIILQQNKEDMGAHRFTWVEQNIVVAATDMPDYDDRPPTKEHYSKVHEKSGIYGLKKLYTNNISADEEIRIVVKKV